jgi:hypothetical protein
MFVGLFIGYVSWARLLGPFPVLDLIHSARAAIRALETLFDR